MKADEDGGAPLPESPQDRVELQGMPDVLGAGGLIQQQDVGARCERPREEDALLLTRRRVR